jgi:hypothetical protein
MHPPVMPHEPPVVDLPDPVDPLLLDPLPQFRDTAPEPRYPNRIRHPPRHLRDYQLNQITPQCPAVNSLPNLPPLSSLINMSFTLPSY